jgi:hypothetical protein
MSASVDFPQPFSPKTSVQCPKPAFAVGIAFSNRPYILGLRGIEWVIFGLKAR